MEQLEQRESWTRSEIDAWQTEKLNELWSHAIAHVPYYSELARKQNLPSTFFNIEEFSSTVPCLPRLVVRDNPKNFLSDAAHPGKWICTSGSSGKPLMAYWSHAAHRQSLQAKYRSYAAWGVDTFDRTVFLWSSGASREPGFAGALSRASQPFIDRLRNRRRLSALTLTRPILRSYLAEIKAFAPTMLYGYSKSLFMLALEGEASGYDSESLKVTVATSEPAWPHMLDAMERVFHAPVAREYGAVECGIMATDIPRDRTLRIREDQVLIETVPRKNGRYDIAVSVFNNFSFPLIRYLIGDITDQPIKYADNRGFAIIPGVLGRNNDFLVARSGAYVCAADVEFAVEGLGRPFVRRYVVYQRQDGSVDLQVEPNQSTDRSKAKPAMGRLQHYLEQRLEGYPVAIRFVDMVEQTRAGKHRTIQSELYDVNIVASRPENEMVAV